ncbi:hypothetical protein CHARACLAT_028820 [Characodon lateralis]|uniref:Uncharacterized protein n=1 Tax=Characodon lateralis TaxID=208331 RepID=A0ABU7DBK6_9TELE|nr:hypothetical protein [Characodon lateralis]
MHVYGLWEEIGPGRDAYAHGNRQTPSRNAQEMDFHLVIVCASSSPYYLIILHFSDLLIKNYTNHARVKMETKRGKKYTQKTIDIDPTQTKERGEAMVNVKLLGALGRLFTVQAEAATTQKDMERSLKDLSDRLTALEKSSLIMDHKKLQEKCTDLENRNRRQNIRIIGVAEGSKANNTMDFVIKFLVQVLGEDNFRVSPCHQPSS